MSRHWQPEGDRADWTEEAAPAPPAAKPWPKGATAGLLLVAACCLTVGAVLYRVAGPRIVIDGDAAARLPGD